MNTTTIHALNAINRSFYRNEAETFSVTRDSPWPGWKRVLELVDRQYESYPPRILDVGCGNGRLVKTLVGRFGTNFIYTGIDSSEALIAKAKEQTTQIKQVRFVRADLVEDPLDIVLPEGPFDFIAIFGLLHHIPSHALRLALIRSVSRTLDRRGLLALSIWRFAYRKRFIEKCVQWSDLATRGFPCVTESELEPGDRLLRWGKFAVRYCHQVNESELKTWLDRLPLGCTLRFREDGLGGDLNEYIVLGNHGE